MALQPEYPQHLTSECKELLKRMLEPDVKQRITMEAISDDPWFTKNMPLAVVSTAGHIPCILPIKYKGYYRQNMGKI
jgi:serine/threonine protein kinase